MTVSATNSLERASSAYLRSAMHQPIRWYEWGEEAFTAAKRDDKPMLLDIGAVWCHWCHVMDRESYDNPDIAQVINEKFIAVKVDRDERPDIDSRYQVAVSAISGQGGWPLTAFLTPDGKPFFGGTYFPPEERFGRPGFKRILEAIAQAYREKHGEVVQSADSVMSSISGAETFAGHSADFSPQIIDSIAQAAARNFDAQHGGFGAAPKFPHPAVLDLLMDRYARSHESFLETVIRATLEGMAKGGVYDQLAGGFHRYSVDERWVVPHFEKMSYDNSELLKNYVHGFQVTGDPFFAEVARDIIRWMNDWLSDQERGGFYASQDADINMDDDGDYFTWTMDETLSALNEEEFKVASLYYDIGDVGEMHHNRAKNVLFVRASLEDIAARVGTQLDRVRALLDSAKQKMYAVRLKRPTPYVDKTVYVNWNAMAVSAYLQASRILRLDDARHFALRSLDRILAEAWQAGEGANAGILRHVIAYSDPKAQRREIRGLLEDYAFTVIACLDAYETTADMSYFSFARRIGDAMIQRFHDDTGGGFFDSEAGAPGSELGALTTRRKPFQDSPTPAGNPAAAIALLRLHAYTNESRYRDCAEDTLELFAGMAPQYGMFAGTYGIAATLFAMPHTQIAVVGNDETAERLCDEALAPFALNKSVLRAREVAAQNLPPALAETLPNIPGITEDRGMAVICSNFACRPPVSSPEDLGRAMKEVLAAA